jgi:hypothetical protein
MAETEELPPDVKTFIVHPNDDVTPLNWRELAIGTGQNPRRGEGKGTG